MAGGLKQPLRYKKDGTVFFKGGMGGFIPPFKKLYTIDFWSIEQRMETRYKRSAGYGCSGAYGHGGSGGLSALTLKDLRANVNNNVGVRPALPLSRKAGLHRDLSSAEGKRSRIPSPLFSSGENIYRRGRLVGRLRIPSAPPFAEGLWRIP